MQRLDALQPHLEPRLDTKVIISVVWSSGGVRRRWLGLYLSLASAAHRPPWVIKLLSFSCPQSVRGVFVALGRPEQAKCRKGAYHASL